MRNSLKWRTSSFKVDGDLLQGIANYLADRPFKEVAQLMQGMQGITEIKKEPVQAPVKEEGHAQC